MIDLSRYPTKPGVYLMLDKKERVLYVGKAKNLRARLRQYFVGGGDGREQIPFLMAKVADVETIVVSNEKEALLLEDTLIKKHKPPYNVHLKDDKSYIALQVRTKSPWPMVNLVRLKGPPKDKNLYFGPYSSALAARETLEEIRKFFPLRQCSDQEFRRRTKPCILYQMKRCIAPCVGLCTKEEYEAQVDQTIRFLRGETKPVIKQLKKRMDEASDKWEYERAGAILQTIRAIEKTLERQRVNLLAKGDFDVIGLYREADEGDLAIINYRGGKLLSMTHFPFKMLASENQELLESAIMQYYREGREHPKILYIPQKLSPKLSEVLGFKLITPQRGEKKRMVEMACDNALMRFRQLKDKRATSERTLLQLQELCHLKEYPHRIDCFDTAHIAGSAPTASLVTFEGGEPSRAGYRSYHIRSTKGVSDDYQAMHEVMERRYKKADTLPNLIIVDGGKGQLNIALKLLKELNLATIDLIALSKDEAKHTKGLTQERIFLPERKDPILLPKHSPILFLLQRIRDEAHRRAIGLHKKQRSKKQLKSVLDEIPGIGPTKKKKLIAHFKSPKKVLEASPEELAEVQGLSKADIRNILKFSDC